MLWYGLIESLGILILNGKSQEGTITRLILDVVLYSYCTIQWTLYAVSMKAVHHKQTYVQSPSHQSP